MTRAEVIAAKRELRLLRAEQKRIAPYRRKGDPSKIDDEIAKLEAKLLREGWA